MLQVVNPYTSKLIAELDVHGREQIIAAHGLAKKVQKEWGQRNYAERAAYISSLGQAFKDHEAELAKTLSQEMGKPLSQALGEVRATCKRINWFLESTQAQMQASIRGGNRDFIEQVSYEPLGLVAYISPWNYPFFMACNVIVPALLCGCVVLHKPSELTPLTGLQFQRFLDEAGLETGVLQTIIGGGACGEELGKLAVDGLFFTGSLSTGQKLQAQKRPGFPLLNFELGGKDAVYVRADVPLEKAALSIAQGCFYNAGQSCCGIERIYVAEAVYQDFLEVFAASCKQLAVGDPSKAETFIGPLARDHGEFLLAQRNQAQDRGAKTLLAGGIDGEVARLYHPTVLYDCPDSCDLMQEESFGPIVGIKAVRDDEEAVHSLNSSKYGLTAGVYSREAGPSLAILKQLECGSVYWNCCDRVSPRLPWSGRKASGIGATLGERGIQAFIRPKAWHLNFGF